MITISLDKKLDKEVFKDFWGFSAEGADFGEKGIKRIHPLITEENATEYITAYYADHSFELEQAKTSLQKAVDKTSSRYFESVERVFGKEYANRSYVGLLSIFDCNPRFVEEKRFQVFYKRDTTGQLGVVYHEVLHLVFFEHMHMFYPDIVKDLDPNAGSYWAFSEVFNVVILNLPDFRNVLGREEQMFYSDLTKYVDPVRELYEKNRNDLGALLSESLPLLNFH